MKKDHFTTPNHSDNTGQTYRTIVKYLRKYIFILFIIICLFYPFIKIQWAKNKIETICEEIAVGMPVETFEKKARELGLRLIYTEERNRKKGELIALAGWAYAHWNCKIEYADGKVTGKESFFLD